MKDFLFFSIPTIIRGLSSFLIITPISTFYLSIEEIAISAIVIGLTGLVSSLADVGVVYVLNGNYYKLQDDKKGALVFTLFLCNLVSHLLIGIIFLLSANFLLSFYQINNIDKYKSLITLGILSSVCNFFYTIITQLFTLNKQANLFLRFDLINWIISIFILVICFEFYKLGIYSTFISLLVCSLFSLVNGLYMLKDQIKIKFEKKWMKEVLVVGIPTMPMSIIESLINSVDKYFIQKNIGVSQLAIFSHSTSYRGIFFAMTKAQSRVIGPEILSFLSSNDDKHISVIKKQTKIWFIGLGAMLIIFILSGEWLIQKLTHGKLTQAAELIPLWIYVLMIQSIAIIYIYALQHEKKSLLLTKIYLISNVSLILMISILSFTGSIILVTFGFVVSKLLWLFLLKRKGNIPPQLNHFLRKVFYIASLFFLFIYLIKYYL